MSKLQNRKHLGKDEPEVGDLYVCLTRTRPLWVASVHHQLVVEYGIGESMPRECFPGEVVMIIVHKEFPCYKVLHGEKAVIMDRAKLMHMFLHLPRAV